MRRPEEGDFVVGGDGIGEVGLILVDREAQALAVGEGGGVAVAAFAEPVGEGRGGGDGGGRRHGLFGGAGAFADPGEIEDAHQSSMYLRLATR